MQKRTLKQKCLAWLLSLAVAVTFIPLTAGFAFAEDQPTEMYINLETANTNNAGGDEIKVFVNFAAPWQDGEDLSAKNTTAKLVPGQVWTGAEMKPELVNVKCRMGAGTFTLDSADDNGNKYFTVDFGEGNWTDCGSYQFKVIANENAAPISFENSGKQYTAKFKGTYTFNCTIADAKDLSNSTIEFDEGNVNKAGEIEVSYDGRFHMLSPTVTPYMGTVPLEEGVDYTVDYPNQTTNAYKKVGKFDIVISAIDGSGYTGSVTKVLSITDVVTDITVYSQNGKNGTRQMKKMFKYAKWSSYALDTPIDWGYNDNIEGTTENYIPIETLLSEAGLGAIGKFNSKDLIDIWTNSEPEHYFNAPQTIATLQKYKYVVKDSEEVLKVIGGEFKIPAFLVLDCDVASMNPRAAVGSEEPNGTPRGNMSPSAVSEIALVSMDINGLQSSVAGVTYTGKALTPAVKVVDGDVEVPVTVTYKDNTNAGTGTVTIKAKDDSEYYGEATKTFTIAKAANTMKVKAKKAPTVKVKKVKKAAQKVKVSKVMTVSKKQGKLSYKKVSGSAKLKIAKSTGQVTVKKGTKKGTYKMKVKVTAAGNNNYKAGSKNVTIKVKVK